MDEPKRKPVDELYCDSVTVRPRYQRWDYDRMVNYTDDEDAWEYWEAVQCEECEEWFVSYGYAGERHADLDRDSDCEGMVYGAEGPMMNYFYPLEGEGSFGHVASEEEMALEIRHLPLCIVRVGGEIGLALTGGGMDLSWEICEAYMLLGHCPPYHFCDLPAMSGRGTSECDLWIIEGCKRTCDILRTWVGRTEEKLDMLSEEVGDDGDAEQSRQPDARGRATDHAGDRGADTELSTTAGDRVRQ